MALDGTNLLPIGTKVRINAKGADFYTGSQTTIIFNGAEGNIVSITSDDPGEPTMYGITLPDADIEIPDFPWSFDQTEFEVI